MNSIDSLNNHENAPLIPPVKRVGEMARLAAELTNKQTKKQQTGDLPEQKPKFKDDLDMYMEELRQLGTTITPPDTSYDTDKS